MAVTTDRGLVNILLFASKIIFTLTVTLNSASSQCARQNDAISAIKDMGYLFNSSEPVDLCVLVDWYTINDVTYVKDLVINTISLFESEFCMNLNSGHGAASTVRYYDATLSTLIDSNAKSACAFGNWFNRQNAVTSSSLDLMLTNTVKIENFPNYKDKKTVLWILTNRDISLATKDQLESVINTIKKSAQNKRDIFRYATVVASSADSECGTACSGLIQFVSGAFNIRCSTDWSNVVERRTDSSPVSSCSSFNQQQAGCTSGTICSCGKSAPSSGFTYTCSPPRVNQTPQQCLRAPVTDNSNNALLIGLVVAGGVGLIGFVVALIIICCCRRPIKNDRPRSMKYNGPQVDQQFENPSNDDIYGEDEEDYNPPPILTLQRPQIPYRPQPPPRSQPSPSAVTRETSYTTIHPGTDTDYPSHRPVVPSRRPTIGTNRPGVTAHQALTPDLPSRFLARSEPASSRGPLPDAPYSPSISLNEAEESDGEGSAAGRPDRSVLAQYTSDNTLSSTFPPFSMNTVNTQLKSAIQNRFRAQQSAGHGGVYDEGWGDISDGAASRKMRDWKDYLCDFVRDNKLLYASVNHSNGVEWAHTGTYRLNPITRDKLRNLLAVKEEQVDEEGVYVAGGEEELELNGRRYEKVSSMRSDRLCGACRQGNTDERICVGLENEFIAIAVSDNSVSRNPMKASRVGVDQLLSSLNQC